MASRLCKNFPATDNNISQSSQIIFVSNVSKERLVSYSNQIKSNFIYMAPFILKKSNTKCRTTMIKHTNPPTPINTQRDTETYRHTRMRTCTHKHTSSDPLHLLDSYMAGHRDLRQGKSHPWGLTTLRGLPATTTRSSATETAPSRADKGAHAKVRDSVVVRLPPFMWVTWVQIPCMKTTTSSRGPQARPPYMLKLLWIKVSAKCTNIN